MTAEIISVGTELLMGQVLNTDARFMAERLAMLGINVYHQITVGDNPQRLKEDIGVALGRADVVILSGGLGPTGDDITKTVVADAFCLPMERDKGAEETLIARFEAINKGKEWTMTPNNLKQADFPKGSILLKNPNGTAQGCIVENGDKTAILLPGPPRELFPMFENEVMPYLEKKSGFYLFSRELRIFGRGESAVEYALRDLMENQTNPTIAPYAKTGETTLRVTARCEEINEGEKMCAPVIAKIKERLGDVVYSDNGVSLAGVCSLLLERGGYSLSVAESCTGGLLCSALVDVPGSSEYFWEGAVTYSDLAKIKRLNVSSTTLRLHGAVSEECAKEMARGVRKSSGTDYGLATTGIAGPTGGTATKPVGLIYVALADKDGEYIKKLNLIGDRSRIREITVLHALDMLRRSLLGLPPLQ